MCDLNLEDCNIASLNKRKTSVQPTQTKKLADFETSENKEASFFNQIGLINVKNIEELFKQRKATPNAEVIKTQDFSFLDADVPQDTSSVSQKV